MPFLLLGKRVSIDTFNPHMYYLHMDTILEIPQDILESARLTSDELKVEIAVYLYASGRLSIGKARELAGLSLWQFRQLLASRQIPPHFNTADLDDDIRTLQESGRL